MFSNFTPNFASNFLPNFAEDIAGNVDGVGDVNNIYPSLDLFFAYDKAFEVDVANPGGCLITSRRGPDAKFSRASGRTFTDSDGLVKWAAENLFSGSGIASWGIDGAVAISTVTQAGPLGEIDVQQIIFPDPATGNGAVFRAIDGFQAGQQITFSDYFRADAPTELIFSASTGGGDILATYPITTEWTRIEHSFTTPVSGTIYFIIATKYSGGGVTGGARTVYRRDVQIERHSSARTYLPTTSAPVYGPAFEHDPVTGVCLGLSRWEQRTNLCLQSEDFTAWNPAGIYTATPNASTGPNGQISADQLDIPPKSGGTYGAVFPNIGASLTVASVYTFSVWLKGATGTEVVWLMWTPDGSTYSRTQCALTTGWQRFELQFTADAGANYLQLGVDSRDTVGGQSSLVAQTFYAWGAQLELGSAMSSYIPTTTAPVVRSADVCSIDGADFAGFYNQSEGTWSGRAAVDDVSIFSEIAFIGGTVGNQLQFGLTATGGEALRIYVLNGGAVQASFLSGSISTGEMTSIAISYKLNDFAACLSGGTVFTDLSGTPPTVDKVIIGESFNGCIARLTYYPKRLSNEKIQQLTA